MEKLRREFDGTLLERLAILEQRVSSQEKAVEAALESSEKAIHKAEISNEKRFEGQNEFREQLKDQAATFITRKEFYAAIVGVLGFVSAILTMMNIIWKR